MAHPLKTHLSRSARLAALTLAAALAGCQTYAPAPLDLEAHEQAWLKRDLADARIAAFAAKLAAAGDEAPAPFNPSDGLSLHEAEAVAMLYNPALRTARAEAHVPLAGAQHAGLWDDPQFDLELLRLLEGGSNPWVFATGVGITLPLSGRLAVEKDQAWAKYAAHWRRIAEREWRTLIDLRRQWLAWSATQRRAQLVRGHVARLEKLHEAAKRLADAGELGAAGATQVQLLDVDIASHTLRAETLDAQTQRQRLALLAIMGVRPDADAALQPLLAPASIDAPADQRRALLIEHHPALRLARAEYEEAELSLRREIRKQYPDLSIGPVFEDEDGQSKLGLGAGIPVPAWNRNKRGIAEAAAARDAARIAAEQAFEDAAQQLAAVEQALAAASQQRRALTDRIAPLVDQQIESVTRLIEIGEVDVLLLSESLSRSLEVKQAMLDAALAEALASHKLKQMLNPRWVTTPQMREEQP